LQSIHPALTTIALAPNGGIFADLIGIELAAQGYTIVDTGATLALLVLRHLPEDDILDPEVMVMLKARGIDAILVAQKADGTDGLPQTVRVRLHSTASMTEVGGVDWENGWFRRGVLESAQEIAAALSRDARRTMACDLVSFSMVGISLGVQGKRLSLNCSRGPLGRSVGASTRSGQAQDI
jgi:hypothetical protein